MPKSGFVGLWEASYATCVRCAGVKLARNLILEMRAHTMIFLCYVHQRSIRFMHIMRVLTSGSQDSNSHLKESFSNAITA